MDIDFLFLQRQTLDQRHDFQYLETMGKGMLLDFCIP